MIRLHGRIEVIFDNEIYKRFPFEIIRMMPEYITLKLDKFNFDDKYEIKRLIEWFPPREVGLDVKSRFVHKDRKERFYLTIYYDAFPHTKNLADLINNKNVLTINFDYHCFSWEKSLPIGIKLKIVLNDKGLAKLFKHLL